jgi:hypothetical protein
MCKDLGAKLAEEKYASMKPNPIAVDLGLEDETGPTTALQQAQLAHNPANDPLVNVVYAHTLDALDKTFGSDMDPATYEEHMRWFFGNLVGTVIERHPLPPAVANLPAGQAYHTFGPDKTVLALIKQACGCSVTGVVKPTLRTRTGPNSVGGPPQS